MKQLTEEQDKALQKLEEFIYNKDPVICLEGSAGVGKTFVLNEYIQFLDSNDINFVLCAPTHKAKLVMEEVTGYGATTLHKLLSLAPNIEIFNLDYKDLKFFSSGNSEIPTKGIIIVDEASMITDELYNLLLEYSKIKNSKLCFIGDLAQLQGVNNGGTSLAFQCPNKITLTQIHRQSKDNLLLPVLTKLRDNPINKFKPIENYLFLYNNAKDFMIEASSYFRKAITSNNTDYVKLIAYTNARVKGLNDCMRKLLWKDELEYHPFEFLIGYENFEYNSLMFYNSLDYLVVNSPKKVDKRIPNFMKLPGYELDLYDRVYKQINSIFILDRTINPDYISSLASVIEDIRLNAIDLKRSAQRQKASRMWKKYFETMGSFATPTDLMFDNRVIKKKTFDYGYASTTHRQQGSSINTVFIDMNNILTCRNREELRQLQYVALSRTKTNAHILI